MKHMGADAKGRGALRKRGALYETANSKSEGQFWNSEKDKAELQAGLVQVHQKKQKPALRR